MNLAYEEDGQEEYVDVVPHQPFSVQDLEAKMLKLDQVDCPVIHRFGPGLYIREVKIPAGTVAIGHYQKREHLNIFLQGRITMLNEDGSTTDLAAPMIFTGKPGRKCGFAHEDVVWLNIYPTEETDVETLEETYLYKSDQWKEEDRLRGVPLQLGDVLDYHKLLKEIGMAEDTVRAEAEDEKDQIPMPLGSYKITVSKSSIEGKGVFATAQIVAGEIIAPARVQGMRTPVGRYTNHSATPNAKMEEFDGDVYLVATREIQGCKGGFLGDEITTDYRTTLRIIGGVKCLQ